LQFSDTGRMPFPSPNSVKANFMTNQLQHTDLEIQVELGNSDALQVSLHGLTLLCLQKVP